MVKLTNARLRVLSRLSDKPTLLIGADLTTSAWLVMKGYAVRHRLNHFSITEAGRAALSEDSSHG